MLARFQYIGRVGYAKVKEYGKRYMIHFSLATQMMVNGKARTQWNNNFTYRGTKGKIEVLSKMFKIGALVYVEGFIFSVRKDGVQVNRFIVDRHRILQKIQDLADYHEDRYGDLPAEEYYDIFEESTDSLYDNKSYFRDTTEENPLTDDL